MKLLTSTEYIEQAVVAIRKSKERVYLLSMVMAKHELTTDLFHALEDAARRGVKVHVAADIFTFKEVSTGFLPFRYYTAGARGTNQTTKELRKAGVQFSWLGSTRATLFSGRTHSKWCIVDDIIFTFGGVNLYQEGILNTDYMFKLEDKRIADRLVEEQNRIKLADRQARNYSSVIYELSESSMLLDGGIIGQSVIYRRACELAKEAESILFVSQYCPTGKLARIFRKRKVALYYNRPEQAKGLNRFLIWLGQIVSGFHTRYKRKPYLHAKFMIFTMPDGTKTALTGSHNFAYTGVLLGTREIALETTRADIISQLETYFEQSIQ